MGMPIPNEYNSVSINLFGVFPRVVVGASEAVSSASESDDIQYW